MFGLFASTDPTTPIRLYDSAARALREFRPLKRGTVLMYTCGPTVYDHIHIGNLRAYLLPDLLHRLFLYNGYTVRLTINVTDFGHLSDDADQGEDKMMKGMRREGYEITLPNMRTFAEPYIASFKEDLLAFGNLQPTTLTRASDYVREEIALIETLMQKGYAYETTDGVYFDVTRFPRYGVLGNIDLAKLKAGARVELNPEKRHPADFALWKKGDLGWKSKWGQGFPGWHIECTAMAFATLGRQIDIHTGGEDLMYTHHNGEIAQAESITGKPYAGYWMHNAFVTINDEKLAKSKGTGIRLSGLIDRGYTPEDYRYWLLQSHYRTPVNFTFEALDAARAALQRIKRVVYEELGSVRASSADAAYEAKFVAALADDLDTPKALAILWELLKDGRIAPDAKLATIHVFDSLLSLNLSKSADEGRRDLGIERAADIPDAVATLLQKREDARTAKNWAAADTLRKEIEAAGYEIKDTEHGPLLAKR